MPTHGLDPERVAQAMKEQGIANANQLALKCHVHRATAINWMEGQVPVGRNAALLCIVLGKSLPWLMGSPIPSDLREVIARAVRAELGQGGECPEADIIEAFGAFSFEQRKLLVDVILHGARKIEGVHPLADARDSKPAEPAATKSAPKSQHRRKHSK